MILANSWKVNTLLHPDTLEYVLGADPGTLENTRRTKCTCRDKDELRSPHSLRVPQAIRVE